jgi:tetratricopeptide (TPR) repeat protein
MKARDLDLLRFRASGECNDAIRASCDDRTLIFADIERAFRENSTDSLIGNNLILEHLHPNSHGYFLMSKEYARIMREHSFLASSDMWQDRDTLPEEFFREHDHLTGVDTMCAVRRTAILTSGWPFTAKEPAAHGAVRSDPIGGIVDRLVGGKMTWEEGHVAAAEFYASNGDPERAAREYTALINQIPQNVSAYLLLGRLYARQGRRDEAREVLQRSLEIERTAPALQMLKKLIAPKK